MTIETPCEVGETVYLKCENKMIEARVTGMKVNLNEKGVQIKIFIHGVFGTRTYDSRFLGKKIFKESEI